MLPLQGAQVQRLVRELGSHQLNGVAKISKTNNLKYNKIDSDMLSYEKYDRERREKYAQADKKNNNGKDGEGKQYRPARN